MSRLGHGQKLFLLFRITKESLLMSELHETFCMPAYGWFLLMISRNPEARRLQYCVLFKIPAAKSCWTWYLVNVGLQACASPAEIPGKCTGFMTGWSAGNQLSWCWKSQSLINNCKKLILLEQAVRFASQRRAWNSNVRRLSPCWWLIALTFRLSHCKGSQLMFRSIRSLGFVSS